MWGTHITGKHPGNCPRFIPAYVGNTLPGRFPECGLPVHPRVCGEHINQLQPALTLFGSSPRMWGTLWDAPQIVVRYRFIPAYVGNTTRGQSCKKTAPVHPRVCGEHGKELMYSTAAHGSSPRMWGTLYVFLRPYPDRRFIPAYVGNTSGLARLMQRLTVHPRVCGEHIRNSERL